MKLQTGPSFTILKRSFVKTKRVSRRVKVLGKDFSIAFLLLSVLWSFIYYS